MANQKKTLLVFTSVDADVLRNGSAASLEKRRQKGALVPLTVERDLRTEAGAGAASGQMIWDAAAEAGLVVEPITEEGSDFFVADAPTEAELLKVLDEALALSSKKLLIVVACPSLAVFYGLGIERGITLEKPVPAASIAPTIAWLGDLPLPSGVEAPAAYRVIKGLNFKMREVRKLFETNASMMEALERGSRKPWEKHDCA